MPASDTLFEVCRRLFELLGTLPEHKRHAALKGGHDPCDWRALIREVLDLFDKYLGPVHRPPGA